VFVVFRTGDLPLNQVRSNLALSQMTLERLYLLENPPRFKCTYYEFGSDNLSSNARLDLKPVALLLLRHKTLKIRVEGRVQPDAPDWIKEKLSERRAESAAQTIWLYYCLSCDATGIDPTKRSLADRIEVKGMRSEPLVNCNFIETRAFQATNEALLATERSPDTYQAWAQLWRRVDISIVSI